jgi:uncharacterized protein with FMN-binding domain
MMKQTDHTQSFNIVRLIKKLFLSAFVVVTFIAYAIHKPDSSTAKMGQASVDPNQSQAQAAPTEVPTTTTQPAPTETTQAPSQLVFPTFLPPTSAPTLAPAAPSQNTTAQNGQYKDGTYTGPEVDAQFGWVQVQAVVKNGKVSNVQFLEYPNDRRTSVRINSVAVPMLQQEAVQAQSANVDLVSGATLTSEAFAQSLQVALNQAKGSL